ncbi:unnamed protein product [Moneuplotes crassus]|uniref:Uncharacterized protein n=2 Tax=Euplotes crassus TaxID=5936 RepID=A0AAD1U121_EUPCR|nr:unnamed protein product [Moneuplotes crassus]
MLYRQNYRLKNTSQSKKGCNCNLNKAQHAKNLSVQGKSNKIFQTEVSKKNRAIKLPEELDIQISGKARKCVDRTGNLQSRGSDDSYSEFEENLSSKPELPSHVSKVIIKPKPKVISSKWANLDLKGLNDAQESDEYSECFEDMPHHLSVLKTPSQTRKDE